MPFRVRRLAARAPRLPALLVLISAPAAIAQQNGAAQQWSTREALTAETYIRPPAEIERLVTAPRHQNVTLSNPSPDRRHFLIAQSEGLPSIEAFGKPHYYLGGLQVDFGANRSRALTTRGATSLTIVDASTGRGRAIDIPRGATVSGAQWSPDGAQIAFIANFSDASRLYVADVATGKARQLTRTPLLATLVTSFDWTSDGKAIAAVFVPQGRGGEPQRPAVETGPLVRITEGDKNKTRTYASLLRDPYERELLEYYTTGQLAVVDAKSGAVRRVGAPAMIYAVNASPDGGAFRVTLMQKPFSYSVPYNSFGQVDELWDANGKKITVLASRPLTPAGGQPPSARAGADTSWRSFGWLAGGSGLYYLKYDPAPAGRSGADSSADSTRGASGQGNATTRRKDRLFQWLPPYNESSRKQLLESDNRIASVLFTDDGKTVFVAENVSGTGHVYATYLDEPAKRYTIWRMRGQNASIGRGRGFFGPRGGAPDDSLSFYQNPGYLMTKQGRAGGSVVLVSSDGRYAYLEGTRYSRDWQREAPRNFVDRVEIKTGEKTRLFEGASDVYETISAPLDDDFTRAVVTRESRAMLPDSYLRDMKSGALTKLTGNRDITPEFTNAIRKKIPVTRADGIRFFVDLTLPSDYTEGTRLPGMLWLYPYEFTDQAGYDRSLRTENINRFPQGGARTIEYLVTQGYAVANFSPPIIGAQGRMNDNYVHDLRNNLAAVIDELDRLGYIDRARLAIGGHSYGAFSTVNAMVHTPFFKAGIAGDGMYNRTLTPNGFQSERRDLWEAPKTYLDVSPFLMADKLTGALLMYHGIDDQNVGTHIISSIRMMHALEGLGKKAALYMYPYEDHGPATKETLLDLWARWTAWLDTHVKNAGQPSEKATTAAAAAR